MKLLFGVLLFMITGCEAKGNVIHTKIKMEDGRTADNCQDYVSLRQQVGLFESTRNKSISSEYLECAYLISLGDVENKFEALEDIYNEMDVSKIPLSIAQSVEKKSTFRSLNWSIDQNKSRIYFENEDVNIVIFLEKKMNDGYLIFVIDEALKGTYRSYFPAKLTVTDNGFEIYPIYKSGY